MKKLLLSTVCLFFIAVAALFAITSTYYNRLLTQNAAALAQDPDRPPFTCTDGTIECWVTIWPDEIDGIPSEELPIIAYKHD